jgi:cell wall-associated NlpC family hydrolase
VIPAVAAALATPVVTAQAASASPAQSVAGHPSAATRAAHSSTAARVARLIKSSPAPTAAVVARPRLRWGSRGEAVRFVQRKLGVHATGYFGPITRAAVRRLQAAAGLRATGVIDHATWRALGITATTKARKVVKRTQVETVPGSTPFGQRVLDEARRFSGIPYVYGGSTPSGFDCSGYVGYVFRQLGVSLPRTAAAIRSRVPYVSASSVRPGDLVFVNRGGGISHVAIYAGSGYWFEASHPGQLTGKHRAWTSSVSYGRVSA